GTTFTEKMRITHNGNVGIANTSPSNWASGYNALQVGGKAFFAAHSSSDSYFGQNAYINSGWKYASTAATSFMQQSGGLIQFYTAPSGAADSAITWKNPLSMNTLGNVGIGTSSPVNFGTNSHGLSINGTGNYQNLSLQKNGTTGFYIYLNGLSGTFLGQAGNQPIMFLTDDAERARIDSDGITIKSGKELRVNRTDNARDIRLFCDNSYGTIETTHDPIRIKSANAIRFDTGGNDQRMMIDTTGNVSIGGTPSSGGSGSRWLSLDTPGTNSYTGGILYKINGTTKGYHYVENDYMM
ncbi:MAG: hypothetical protein ACKVJK_23425, partial [Methylophagaceae bacterium]